MTEWLKAEDAAERLGISMRQLRRRGQQGKIPRRLLNGYEHEYQVGEKPERKPAERPTMIVGLFDVHVPDHDRAIWRSCLEFIRDQQPDEVVIGGDFLELESCSQHGGNPEPPGLEDDLRAGRRAVKQLREAAPDARMTYLEGNHETRLQRSVISYHPRLHGVITVPEQLGLYDLDIEWVPESSQPVARGKLNFLHGVWTNKYHAAKHVSEYGASVTYGHTHVPQVHTIATIDRQVHGAYGMPCMRTLDPDWMKGKPSNWCSGFGVYYIWPDGRFNAYPVLAFQGRFVFGGKTYGA